MNNKTTYTAALLAMGLISAASTQAQTQVKITGSTAFRGNFFTAATAVGGIFPGGGTAVLGGSGSSQMVIQGTLGGTNYALCCFWSGSEAGIANLAGKSSLLNPGLVGSGYSGGTGSLANSVLPNVFPKFPNVDGSAGSSPSFADLALADTSQAVSLTPPTVATLHDYGTLGCVTFVWAKGKNSGDSSWNDLTNVIDYQLANSIAGNVKASYFTGVTGDADPIVFVGRNAGSGTRANMLTSLSKNPVLNGVNQAALNSFYNGSGVLTYNIVTNGFTIGAVTLAQDATDSALTYPSVSSCYGNSITSSSGNATSPTFPDVLTVVDDGYDSGAFVSDCLSCDGTGSGKVVIGYAGISDATHAKNGVAYSATETAPSQPGGAVWLTLNGVAYSDANVVIGTYPYWGHEHLLGTTTPSGAAEAVSLAISTAMNSGNVGVTHANIAGLGDGTAGPSAAIQGSVMASDKPSGSDSGFPAPIIAGHWGKPYAP